MSNPWTAPSSPPPAPDDELDAYRETVVAMRFPVLLLGGLGGLMALALVAFAAIAVLGSTGMAGPEQTMVIVLGAIYGVVGALYAVPAGLLVRSGIAGILARGEPEQALVSLRAQLWFWRLVAVYVLGLTALYVVALGVAVGAGLFAAR